MDAAQNVVIGIVSGILTSAVLFGFGLFWTKAVLPWYREAIYSGVVLARNWGGRQEMQGGFTEVVLAIEEQHALELVGSLHIRHRTVQGGWDLSFRARGEVWEGYVSLSFRPIERSVTSISNALLKIDGGGNKLSGIFTFRNVNIEKVDFLQIALFDTSRGIAPPPDQAQQVAPAGQQQPAG